MEHQFSRKSGFTGECCKPDLGLVFEQQMGEVYVIGKILLAIWRHRGCICVGFVIFFFFKLSMLSRCFVGGGKA